MRKKKKQASTNHKKPPVVKLTDEERIEYNNRYNLIITKQMELTALSNYMDQYQEKIREKYDLPERFDLTLATGEIHVYWEEEVDATSV